MDIRISNGFEFGATSMSIDTFVSGGRAELMDLGMDLVLVYPSKPAALPS
jgi:hypothetical protein